MRIVNVICSAGKGGFFFDDQKAIKQGAAHDGLIYKGKPVTKGFKAIRQASESISVMLVLSDGQIAYGDCAAVQYSGVGGRDPVFLAKDFIPFINKHIAPLLRGKNSGKFRELAEKIDNLQVNGKRVHTAIRYGISMALLDAAAKSNGVLMCEVIAKEYKTKVSKLPIKIFSQSGDDRYLNADKMIVKQSDVLPHALINNVSEKLGKKGEKLLAYVKWLRDRILKLRSSKSYNPALHIDVYGTIGLIFDHDINKICSYLSTLEKAAKPFALNIEGPVDMGGREVQCYYLKELCRALKRKKIKVKIVADEWANTLEDIKLFADENAGDIIQIKTPDLGGINNTIEAVLYCKKKKVGAYLGGTCAETDRSAQVCVHAALATGPSQMLAKPGMGVDEGFMIVYNEMRRTLSLLNSKKRSK
ncbi:MAG: methylaspartate ammonia-lyase [Candidatus Firestonebacteria bacterium RIFOXYA2_FULL_40_8]|nr:MAG: methylaspartate ammonia-lyase [Candidatus Firestonebacteria bacterium RIFOXYA2_FULL_40_8]